MLKNVIIFKLLHGLYLNGDMLQKTETYQSSKLKKYLDKALYRN